MILLLLGLGLEELSMNPASIPKVRQMISKLDTQAAFELAMQAVRCSQSKDIEVLLQEALKELGI